MVPIFDPSLHTGCYSGKSTDLWASLTMREHWPSLMSATQGSRCGLAPRPSVHESRVEGPGQKFDEFAAKIEKIDEFAAKIQHFDKFAAEIAVGGRLRTCVDPPKSRTLDPKHQNPAVSQ